MNTTISQKSDTQGAGHRNANDRGRGRWGWSWCDALSTGPGGQTDAVLTGHRQLIVKEKESMKEGGNNYGDDVTMSTTMLMPGMMRIKLTMTTTRRTTGGRMEVAVIATGAVSTDHTRSPSIEGFAIPPHHSNSTIQVPSQLSSSSTTWASCGLRCLLPPSSTLVPSLLSPASDYRKEDRQGNHPSGVGRRASDREKEATMGLAGCSSGGDGSEVAFSQRKITLTHAQL